MKFLKLFIMGVLAFATPLIFFVQADELEKSRANVRNVADLEAQYKRSADSLRSIIGLLITALAEKEYSPGLSRQGNGSNGKEKLWDALGSIGKVTAEQIPQLVDIWRKRPEAPKSFDRLITTNDSTVTDSVKLTRQIRRLVRDSLRKYCSEPYLKIDSLSDSVAFPEDYLLRAGRAIWYITTRARQPIYLLKTSGPTLVKFEIAEGTMIIDLQSMEMTIIDESNLHHSAPSLVSEETLLEKLFGKEAPHIGTGNKRRIDYCYWVMFFDLKNK
jgi:hypothetical protein